MRLVKTGRRYSRWLFPKSEPNKNDTRELKRLWLKGKGNKTEPGRRAEPFFLSGPGEWKVPPPRKASLHGGVYEPDVLTVSCLRSPTGPGCPVVCRRSCPWSMLWVFVNQNCTLARLQKMLSESHILILLAEPPRGR